MSLPTVLTVRIALLCTLAVSALPTPSPADPPPARPWNQDVIYFALTDRFLDGDPDNNVPAGSEPALYDPTQTVVDHYQGGDFRGLELAIQRGYFNDLGVTALWITPPVRNVWYSACDADLAPKTGYHGYWTQDFLDIDPHLTSRRSLDGRREYADSRDGRMAHYRDFVTLAHAHGLKIIQDIVLNHAGPVFYYDANGNGAFDRDHPDEWVQPFRHDGPYPNAHWAETPAWNQHRAAPTGPVTILGREVHTKGLVGDLESYGRRGMSPHSLGKTDGEEIECDFFGLRDFWTAPDGPRFDDLVDEFVEIYAFYVEEIGVDGFRIDTIKHVHHAFWDAFTERLRRRLGSERAKSLILFGEVYDGNPLKAGEYTYRLGWPADPAPCLDGVLGFQYCYALRSYLRPAGEPYGTGEELAQALGNLRPVPPPGGTRPFYNPTPGADGLNSEQKIVHFIENHDGLNRFRVAGISERRNFLANAVLLLTPGIPCLYYGTEAGLLDPAGKINADTETGRLTFVHAGDSARLDTVEQSDTFRGLAALCALRRELPALTVGEFVPLSMDRTDGVIAFARAGEGIEPVVIVLNANNEARTVGPLNLSFADGRPLLAPGRRLERETITGADAVGSLDVRWQDGAPQVSLHLGAESLQVYTVR